MFIQLLVGAGVSAVCIVMHAVVTVGAVRIARAAVSLSSAYRGLHLPAVMTATAFVLMLAHTLEIFVWSMAYAIVRAAPENTSLVYFAFVNYTTLGYGDVIPRPEWRLLGPMTAMNGILMFGWSTALIFEVLLKTIDRYQSQPSPTGDGPTGLSMRSDERHDVPLV